MPSLLFTNPDLKPFPPPGRCPTKWAILAGLGTLFFACGALAAPPNFVQSNSSTPTAPQSQVTVPFKSSQTVGNLNVVVVGWNDASAQVLSLTDSQGNIYQLAVGPTVLTDSPALSQSIYYAKNISAATAGANTVTLTFTKAAGYPDVRIVEYSGIDPVTPVDVVVGATGNSVTSSSSAVITKNALDLLVGANIIWTVTGSPGSGFIQRMITSDGDIVEDRVVTAVGSYSASANLNTSGAWIMQMVAFRAAGSPASTPSPTPTPTPTPTPPPVALAYVQGNDATPQSPLASVTVPYTIAQGAGDLNVVIVGWNGSTSQVSSVTDSKGNVYQLAVGPTVLTGPPAISQSIYYAKCILPAAAGANVVTVNLNAAANYVDLRIVEYCGVDQVSPLEVSAAATGSSATTSSGTLITKNATDLLVGANTVWTSTTGPGAGFTQRLLTNDGDIVQDRTLTAAGSYSAPAPLSSAGPWIAQAATFRTASSAAPTPTPTPTGPPKTTPTPIPTATPTTTPTLTPTPTPTPITTPPPTPTPTPITTPTPVSTPTPTPSPTDSVSLSWSAETATTNPATNAVGYKLSTGFSSGSYTQVTDLGKATSVTVPMQKSGSTYFFVVTAYNNAGVSGPSSNEVSAKAP
jgi:hypothetical protein